MIIYNDKHKIKMVQTIKYKVMKKVRWKKKKKIQKIGIQKLMSYNLIDPYHKVNDLQTNSNNQF